MFYIQQYVIFQEYVIVVWHWFWLTISQEELECHQPWLQRVLIVDIGFITRNTQVTHGSLHRSALTTWQLPAPKVRTQTRRRQKQAARCSVACCWDPHTLDSPLVTGQLLKQKGGWLHAKNRKKEPVAPAKLHRVAPRHLQR